MGRFAAAAGLALALGGAGGVALGSPARTLAHPVEPAPLERDACGHARPAEAGWSEAINFWRSGQRRGTNFFDRSPDPAKYAEARAFGIDFVRLAPDKWPGAEGVFLIGDLFYYDGLVEADLHTLLRDLDAAAEAGMPVVLTALRLPGLSYRNADRSQTSLLWREAEYVDQAVRYWRDLARALAGHPAVVAYNVINEPEPPRPGQLDDLYDRIIEAIRSVDPDTPVLLDGSGVASPAGLAQMEPHADPGTLYAFHVYQPRPFTAQEGEQPIAYPGPIEGADGGTWDSARLSRVLQPVRDWQAAQRVPSWRIVAAEFGGDRDAPGLPAYFADVVGLLNAECWHWAFYAFREDGWDRMDYERGAGRPAFEVLRRALAPADPP